MNCLTEKNDKYFFSFKINRKKKCLIQMVSFQKHKLNIKLYFDYKNLKNNALYEAFAFEAFKYSLYFV